MNWDQLQTILWLRWRLARWARGELVGIPRTMTLLEALELGSLCAHGGGIPAPMRSLLRHFPDELGLT